MSTNIIVTNPRLADINDIVAQIARYGVPDDAVIIYDGGRNTVYRLSYKGADLTVKSFHKPKLINSWVYTTFRKSKARRSFENAARLNDLGFHSPEPVGYSEQRQFGRLRSSYYTCIFLPSEDLRHCDQKPDADNLLRALACEMVKLHGAKVFNKDFSPGNILYTRDNGGKYIFHYVDVNRMEFGVADRDKLMRNFRALSLNADQLADLARYYAIETRLDPDAMQAEALERFAGYLRQQKRKNFFKKILVKLHLRRDKKR